MPKENRSKYAILGMLDFMPMSGYDIRKFAAMSIAHFWKEDYGHIYPTLKVLHEEGLAALVGPAVQLDRTLIRQRVAARFDLSVVARNYLNLYEQIVTSGGKPALPSGPAFR